MQNRPNFSWGENQYRPQGYVHGYQPQAQWVQSKKQSESMSVEDILKKIIIDQDQLVSYLRNNQLSTENLEKQFVQFVSA